MDRYRVRLSLDDYSARHQCWQPLPGYPPGRYPGRDSSRSCARDGLQDTGVGPGLPPGVALPEHQAARPNLFADLASWLPGPALPVTPHAHQPYGSIDPQLHRVQPVRDYYAKGRLFLDSNLMMRSLPLEFPYIKYITF